MSDDLERLVGSVYKRWKSNQKPGGCPDENTFAAFLDHTLPEKEQALFKAHIAACGPCAELLAACIRASGPEDAPLPEELAQSTRKLLDAQRQDSSLQILVRAKDKVLELLSTNADVLVGQELVPAALLRSRNIRDFPDEVKVLKDFQGLVVSVSVRAQADKRFAVSVAVREKQTQKPAEDLRVSLIRDGVELESSVSEKGAVVFEHIEPGKYAVEASGVAEQVAAILIDITV